MAKDGPDLVVLAVSLGEALELAPELAESNWTKAPFWGGATLGFRDVGAAFNSLELKLSVLSPVTNLAADDDRAVREFVQRYLDEHQKYPTWISALAYDGLNLAIKAASAGGSTTEILAFLNGEPHHSLGRYELSAGGGGGALPMEFMPVTENTLGFLP
ncbi:ABC transporter substrate-binding protein [Deltaproteobacteria bacterium OttesenSCG-928-M10]|nr:ABC transporter substrate-binding protein [Deltaproteobacteria bacterium OttesenSCG-928-M10]